MNEFSHLDEQGNAHMVDVGNKPESRRTAIASATVQMRPETLSAIQNDSLKKGDVLQVARLAGIMAAKQTGNLIPLCHPLGIDTVSVDFSIDEKASAICTTATVSIVGRTGVEMEAMTAASITALTIYDMCKSIDRGMTISAVQLEAKTGGKSGDYKRVPSPAAKG